MRKFDEMKLGVEILSEGKNTVVFNDIDMPSVMVKIPAWKENELYTGGSDKVHPAFVVGNTTHNVVGHSKYINTVIEGRAYSLPSKEPTVNITYQDANAACMKNGKNFVMTPFLLWGAIALWSKKNKTLPHGNNNWGSDWYFPNEHAKEAANEGSNGMRTTRTFTGTGPNSWSHDHTPAGIMDMNGNVWKWCSGMRLNKGLFQFIQLNDLINNCNNSTNCTNDCDSCSKKYWKYIKYNSSDYQIAYEGEDSTGSTSDSLGLKYNTNHWELHKGNEQDNSSQSTQNCMIKEITTTENGVTIPNFLKDTGLFPVGPYEEDYQGQRFWANAGGIYYPSRGADWLYGTFAGSFATNVDNGRTNRSDSVGFFSAYYGDM